MVPAEIAQRSHSGEPMGSVTSMTAGADAEVAQVPGCGAPRRADPLDERAGRSDAPSTRAAPRGRCAAPPPRTGPIRPIRSRPSPSTRAPSRGAGRSIESRRPGPGREPWPRGGPDPMSRGRGGRSRPGERQVVEDQLGRDVRDDQDRRSTEAVEEGIQRAGVESAGPSRSFRPAGRRRGWIARARAGTRRGPARCRSKARSGLRPRAGVRRPGS